MTAASVETPAGTDATTEEVAVLQATRWLAVAAAVVLLWSYVSILWTVTTVVGGRDALALVVLVALLLATASARFVDERLASLFGVGAFLVGAAVYALSVPGPYLAVATLSTVVADAFVLLTGNLTIMRIVGADVWAVSMAPAPVFLTWYLALRRRYELAALVGMAALGTFVLTGDAPTTTTLIGATSVLAMLGFGAIEGMDGDWRQLQDLGLVLAAAVLAARLLHVVPERGLAAGPSPTGSGGTPTVEGSLVTVDEELPILGSVSLSPAVRFEVTVDRPSFWHASAYDRYAGDTWLRSGQSESTTGRLSSPPGPSQRVTQTYEVKSSIGALPTVWRPTEFLEHPRTGTAVTNTGSVIPTGSLDDGDSYAIVSEVPDWSRDRLRDAGTDYPPDVAERYLQVPQSTPDRLAEHAAEITAAARTPYDVAVAVERWLAENKGYSLTVDRPDGDVADGFVFGMEAGYCTYFATAMAVMLRTQGVPTRFAVGYAPGEQVDDDRWVVRGLDSHAWVEVYFPDTGWVPFDPTPATQRREAERARIEHAREAGTEGVDTDDTDAESTDEPTPTPTPTATPNGTETAPGEEPTPLPDGPDPGVGAEPNGSEGTPPPTPQPNPEDRIAAGYEGETTAASPDSGEVSGGGSTGRFEGVAGDRDRLTLLAGAAGVALGVYRFGLAKRGYDAFRLRVQRRTDSPDSDAIRAFERLELLLADRFRERFDGETPRAYLRALDAEVIDDRVYRVTEMYERAYYGEGVTREAADEAMGLVDDLVGEYGRF